MKSEVSTRAQHTCAVSLRAANDRLARLSRRHRRCGAPRSLTPRHWQCEAPQQPGDGNMATIMRCSPYRQSLPRSPLRSRTCGQRSGRSLTPISRVQFYSARKSAPARDRLELLFYTTLRYSRRSVAAEPPPQFLNRVSKPIEPAIEDPHNDSKETRKPPPISRWLCGCHRGHGPWSEHPDRSGTRIRIRYRSS